MGRHDLTVRELLDVKAEIKKFVDNNFLSFNELEKNQMIFVLKKVVLLKYVLRYDSSDYKINAMISDLLYLIKSLDDGEERYYYFNIRSIIEHSLRIVNNLESVNTITNSEIMGITKRMIVDEGIDVNLDIIKNEYSTSCLYIHGNENSNMNLSAYYDSFYNKKEIMKNLASKLNILVKLLNEIFNLIIIKQNEKVDHSFYRRKSILKYLLGDSSYLIFETNKKE